MGKRFSRYQFALKANRGEAQAGSPLDDYKTYKNGSRTVQYNRTAAMNPGGKTSYSGIPFGESTNLYYNFQIGSRTTGVIALVGGETTLKIQVTSALAPTDRVTETSKFSPAIAVVFKPTGATSTPSSRITGVSYRKRAGQSYSFPFCRGVTADNAAPASFKSRAIAIQQQAVTGEGNANNTVSFKPEILRAF